MDNLVIRDATVADLEAINRIYNDEVLHGTATWDEQPWPLARRYDWFAEHDATTPVLVAEMGGAVAGFAYLSHYRPKSGYRHTREDTIYIDADYRGRRIGDRLLGDLVERARRIGVHCLIGIITADNVTSLRLHARHGFVEAGTAREIGRKFGRWLDVTTVQLLLPGPSEPG